MLSCQELRIDEWLVGRRAARRATKSQKGPEKSSGHRVARRATNGQKEASIQDGTEWPGALSGQEGVEWPGNRRDRSAPSSWLSTDFQECLAPADLPV